MAFDLWHKWNLYLSGDWDSIASGYDPQGSYKKDISQVRKQEHCEGSNSGRKEDKWFNDKKNKQYITWKKKKEVLYGCNVKDKFRRITVR